MSNATDRYQVNTAHVVHEVFEDEVLVVNLDNGDYFSLLGASARIWQCILAGASVGETLQALQAAYDGDASAMAAATLEFIAALSDEHLIVAAAGDPAAGAAALPAAGGLRKPFAAPKLEKFTDMQELLLLDPVHDVEDVGWPVARQPPAPPSET